MNTLVAIAPEDRTALIAAEDAIKQCPQHPVDTEHLFHAGMYARTIKMPQGMVLSGATVKIPTLLIVHGDVNIYTPGRLEVVGYAVLAGEAGRKAIFRANADSEMTMIFPTQATTVEEAENEFTDDAHMLMSRKEA